MTCHNRKNKTLSCLHALHQQVSIPDVTLKVYLVDDRCTDGTGEEVKSAYPKVIVLKGNGNLFWCGGMRLAWEEASKLDYDFFLWLNDDTILDNDSFNEILETYQEALKIEGKPVLVVGSCRLDVGSTDFSYGGRHSTGPVVPNGKIQSCSLINGNAVLIPEAIFHAVGNLSADYTHSMGDYDYGLRVIRNGNNCYTTRKYIATCPRNPGIPAWCNPKLSFVKRWKQFHSPKGLNIKEYIKFRKRFWGGQWIIFALKAYLKMLSPSIYQKITGQ